MRRSVYRIILALAGIALATSAWGVSPGGAPPEVTGLEFPTNKSDLIWDDVTPGQPYNVYRGLVTGLPGSYGNCLLQNLPGPAGSDAALPLPGQVLTYLAVAVDGVTESTLGQRSDGTTRLNLSPCLFPLKRDALDPNGLDIDGVVQGVTPPLNPGLGNDLNKLGGGGVVLQTGEFMLELVDMTIPGRGFNFSLARTYRSQINHDGLLGFNWTMNHDRRVFDLGGGNLGYFDGRGNEREFTPSGVPGLLEPVEPGLYQKMRRIPNVAIELRERDGLIYRHFPLDGSPVSGMLSEIVDRYGNRMTFLYDAAGRLCHVIDTLGRQIDFHHDGDGRLERVVDFSGRELIYGYDGNGDLAEVTAPAVVGTPTGNDFPGGKTTLYSYSSGNPDPRLNHNLLAITAPGDFAPALENFYNADDELQDQRVGGLNGSGVPAGGFYSYAITKIGARLVQVTDRRGFQSELAFDPAGHIVRESRFTAGLRPGDPPVFETEHVYNPAGERIQTTNPSGNVIAYQYDALNPDRFQRGNLLEIVRVADGRGDGFGGVPDDIISRYEYDPIYNQQRSIMDPRGTAPGVPLPERFESNYLFDYQEGDPNLTGLAPIIIDWNINLGAIPLNLGDLNGDGTVQQIGGNPILLEQPDATLLPGGLQQTITGATAQQIVTVYRYNDLGQLAIEIDPEKNVKSYRYYSETDPDGDGLPTPGPIDGRLLDPSTGGYLAQQILDDDPFPFLTPVEIASRNNATNPVPVFSVNSFEYDALGNLTASVDANEVRTEFDVNQLGQIVQVRRGVTFTSPGFVSQQIYNERDELVQRRVEEVDGAATGDGFVDTFYTYDMLGNVVDTTSDVAPGLSATTQYRYDANENRVATIFPEGNTFTLRFDERDLVFGIVRGDDDLDAANGGPPGSSEQIFNYDANGNPTEFVDGNLTLWKFEYDGFDRRVRGDVVPGQSLFETRWNRIETPQSTTVFDLGLGAPLHLTQYQYDEMGRLVGTSQQLLDAAGAPIFEDADGDSFVESRFEYDRNSRRTRMQNDAGRVQDFEYDGAGRVLRSIDALNNQAIYQYDALGNLLQSEEQEFDTGEVFATNYLYDDLGRLREKTDSAATTRSYEYDSLDNLVQQTDALGNTIGYRYDAQGRRTEVVRDLRVGGDGTGAVFDQIVNRFEYDLNGRPTQTIDPESNPVSYRYDELNRKIQDILVDGTTIDYGYDANDNVVFLQDANGTQVEVVYDSADRPRNRFITPAPGVAGGTQSFDYDSMNRLIQAEDFNALGDATNVTRVYDSLNRLREETSQFNGNPPRVNTYFYDGTGNRMQANLPTNFINYAYDPLDRLLSTGDAVAGFNAGYDHIGVSRLRARINGNGTERQNVSFADRLVTELTHFGPGAVPDTAFVYEYDAENNLRSETRIHDGGLGDVWRYDSAYRLVEFLRDVDDPVAENAVPGSGGAIQRRVAYELDRVGNWKQREVLDLTGSEPSGTFGNQINNLNDYGEKPDDGIPDDFNDDLAVPFAAGINLQHDDNGNLILEGSRSYQYDALNRLVVTEDGADRTEYVYDALNRRVVKRSFPVGPDQATRYHYDGDRVVEEYELSPANVEQFVKRRYFYGLEEHAIAYQDVLAGNLFYLHEDVRGNIRALTGPAGNVIERYTYDAYGRVEVRDAFNVPTGSPESLFGNPFLYSGHYYDVEIDAYQTRGSIFAPRFGRYLQRLPPGQLTGPLGFALNVPSYLPSFDSWFGMNPFWWCRGWFWHPGVWWVGRWAWRPFWWWGGAWGWWGWRPWLWVGIPYGWWSMQPWHWWWGAPFRWWGWRSWVPWYGWWGYWPWWGWGGWSGWLPYWGWYGWRGWWSWWGWHGWWYPGSGWWGWCGWWPHWNVWTGWHPYWWWGWWTWYPWWWHSYWGWSGVTFWWNWWYRLNWWPWGWWNWLGWGSWWGWIGWNPWWWWGWWSWSWYGWGPFVAWWGWLGWWPWFGFGGFWGWMPWWWWGWWAWGGWFWPWWVWIFAGGWWLWPWRRWFGWWRWPWWGWWRWWGNWWPWWGWWG